MGAHYGTGKKDDTDDQWALQPNDHTFTELTSQTVAPGKNKLVIFAMGYNHKPVRNPVCQQTIGVAISSSVGYLRVHQDTLEEANRQGYYGIVMNTYSADPGFFVEYAHESMTEEFLTGLVQNNSERGTTAMDVHNYYARLGWHVVIF